MLFYPESIPEKDESAGEKIYGHHHFRVAFDDRPGFFHFTAPVNIMKNKERIRRFSVQQLPEITQDGIFPVMTIYEYQVWGC